MQHLALLRGINVGGNNIIKKEALKKLFEDCGFTDVRTYIQSGNILFSTSKSKTAATKAIADALEQKMEKAIPVLVFTQKEYEACMASAPKHWGKDPEQKTNALFILDASAIEDLKELSPKMNTNIESATLGDGAIFWSASREEHSKTQYGKDLVKHPLYKKVTIRNANTSFKLLELLQSFERAE